VKCRFKKKAGAAVAQELTTELTSTDFTIWHFIPAPCCQLYKPNMNVPVVYYPSLIILETILVNTMT
jgi:hypothetical protein